MSLEERISWNERFRTGDHAASKPDPFLLSLSQYTPLYPKGRRALDVACGAGRHTVWLAQNGWSATGLDIALEGLRRARSLAIQNAVSVDLACLDLDELSLPECQFDLIICFFYLQRKLFPILRSALRPGGLVVYKTYTSDQCQFPGRPQHPLHLLRPQELLEEFRGFRVLIYQEVVKEKGVAQILAQKV